MNTSAFKFFGNFEQYFWCSVNCNPASILNETLESRTFIVTNLKK